MSIDRNAPCFCGSGKKVKKCHGFDNDSAFSKLVLITNKIDNEIKLNADMSKLKCKNGCSECCYQIFSISGVEFYYLAYNIIKNHGLDKFKEYVDKGMKVWEDFSTKYPEASEMLMKDIHGSSNFDEYVNLTMNFDKDLPFLNKLPCPFLNLETNSCEVYEYRPLVCRYYGVGYINKSQYIEGYCSHTIDGTDYTKYQADLTKFTDEINQLAHYLSPKYNVLAFDRAYPIFYYFKIVSKNIDLVYSKIRERKDISKNEFADRRMERAINRGR